jgi:phage/conjugal plasmid C-4 type zinc finger TraR family protein
MDDLDRAQGETTRHNNQALTEHRDMMSNTGPGAEICEECGDPIPEERRRMARGCTHCTACQTEIDRRR